MPKSPKSKSKLNGNMVEIKSWKRGSISAQKLLLLHCNQQQENYRFNPKTNLAKVLCKFFHLDGEKSTFYIFLWFRIEIQQGNALGREFRWYEKWKKSGRGDLKWLEFLVLLTGRFHYLNMKSIVADFTTIYQLSRELQIYRFSLSLNGPSEPSPERTLRSSW